VAIGDARIGDVEPGPFRAADRRFIALQQQQARACRLAIYCKQTCGLRPQHERLLSRSSLKFIVAGKHHARAI
jgi:hypothetical protein